ncbi:ubiquitin carboxyl-terminal hydrolase 18-like [Andrographis paniculata]|uniref:ubiquitin carboxyl-terminal hydrolase 18-like n=1 Tax=Andrographis paniculata TaxID=175694 RepID=UPI0021E829BD|nr:ubiquitin carboxyl-terminal hydrolase 18-like [Andrographis paniculata]
MHVAADLNWFLQFIVLAFAGAFGLLYLVRDTASRYFVVDSNFDTSAADYSSLDRRKTESTACVVCGLLTKKQCARCKMVKYCSEACQRSHWNSEHKTTCKDFQSCHKANHIQTSSSTHRGRKTLGPAGGNSKKLKPANRILFPYEEFVEYFKWDKPGYPPCGLLNCGNSCFANVVLQCLSYTRPLVVYLLEKGHRSECQRDDWCFLCEFQTHVERASRSVNPFSPMNILSRLPNIGGNLGYGKQEDAHEFMRFAIDTMQSVCLDEFGGEKVVHPNYQATTLIQHIFGGRLRSQVICAECNNVSNQFENMMDLTVEIHGDAGSLEECLDQFTAKESLHGDNMYKCDGCNAYVMAWKRLTIQQAPNILTIALKRFQSGRFGKLNKRVTFPETLNLSPYMSELEEGNIYKLYAVIVHVDMLNASFFGHYICYVKDFRGTWYRIDDCKVARVDLDDVLSQGAYMLLYSRTCARPSCLLLTDLLKKEESEIVKTHEVDPSLKQPAGCSSIAACMGSPVDSEQPLTIICAGNKINCEKVSSSLIDSENARGDMEMVVSGQSLSIVKDLELNSNEGLSKNPETLTHPGKVDMLPNSTKMSLINNACTRFDAEDSESSVSVSDGENANCDSEVNVNVSSMRKLTKESCVAETHFFKEDSAACNVSAMDITNAKVQDKANPANSTFTPRAKYGKGSLSSENFENAAKKAGEGSSSGKKPLFPPGFLGKSPKRKCVQAEDRTSAEATHSPHDCHLNNSEGEDAKVSLTYGNGSLPGDGTIHIIHENGKA